MPVNKEAIRRRLFKVYATNLQFFHPEFQGERFACPICGKLDSEKAVEAGTLGVTLGHVWPESADGTLKTLECKSCNSNLGGRYDHQIVEDFRVWNAFGGSGTQSADDCRIVFEFDGKMHSVGVDVVYSKESGLHMRAIGAKSDQRSVAALQKYFTQNAGTPTKWTLHMPTVHQQKHTIAVLHSAYLSMFRHFGYEYVFCADHEWIRNVLLSTKAPDKIPIVSVNVAPEGFKVDASEVMHGVAILRFANGLKCFGVPQPTPDPKTPIRVVLMPGFFEEGQEDFRAIQDHGIGDEKINFDTLFEIDEPEKRLVIPEAFNYGRELWIRAFK